VADKLIEVAKTLRVGNLHALLQIGSMGHELTKKNLTLFARRSSRGFGTSGTPRAGEHKWWPQGATERSASGTSIGTERSASGTSIGTERSASGTSIGKPTGPRPPPPRARPEEGS